MFAGKYVQRLLSELVDVLETVYLFGKVYCETASLAVTVARSLFCGFCRVLSGRFYELSSCKVCCGFSFKMHGFVGELASELFVDELEVFDFTLVLVLVVERECGTAWVAGE